MRLLLTNYIYASDSYSVIICNKCAWACEEKEGGTEGGEKEWGEREEMFWGWIMWRLFVRFNSL